MSDPKLIARYLHSAGGYLHPENGRLFYIEDDTLLCKEWNGKSFGDGQFVPYDIRPGSTVEFLEVTNSSRRIIYVSPESALLVSHYDEEDPGWVNDEEAGISDPSTVHSEGALAVCQGNVIFQDHAKHLVFLDCKSWKRTVLPVNAVAGSPLATLFEKGKASVFYVSSEDKYLHHITQDGRGSWSDAALTNYSLDSTPKRILVERNSAGAFETYMLTKDNDLNLVKDDGSVERLGLVTDKGEFVKLHMVGTSIKPYWGPSSSGGAKKDAKKSGVVFY